MPESLIRPPSLPRLQKQREHDDRGQYFIDDEVLGGIPQPIPPQSTSTTNKRKQTKPSKICESSPEVVKREIMVEDNIVSEESSVVIPPPPPPPGNKKRKRDSESSNPPAAETESPPTKNAKKSSTDSASCKRRPSTVKSEDVENAMAAMFAGIKEEPADATTDSQQHQQQQQQQQQQPSVSNKKTVKKEPKKKSKSAKLSDREVRNRMLKASKTSAQDRLLAKYQGPFVVMDNKSVAEAKWSNVVNSPLDDLKKSSSGRKKGVDDYEAREVNYGGPSSTLNPSYDAKKPDESWVCVFCKKGSHHCGMGDLFGPYFVSSSRSDSAKASPSPKKKLAASFILGGDGSKKKKKRKSGEIPLQQQQQSLQQQQQQQQQSQQREIWFHEDCVCWMADISLIGSRLIGLEAAVENADEATCVGCKQSGSTIACIKAGCKDVAHFPCAGDANWAINEYDFEAYCPKHSS